MRFEYMNKQYDIRLKARYLPQPLRDIDALDLIVFVSNRSTKQSKQTLLNSYLKGARVL